MQLPRPSALARLLPISRPLLSFQLLGRMLLRTMAVGAAAGLVGSLFVAGVERLQTAVLENTAGYLPLRAAGEGIAEAPHGSPEFRAWLLWIVPALGALVAGVIVERFAPETRGGGSDAIIDAFHNRAGVVRRRVPLVKAIVSILTLGTGGSGGREGPTMQIGGSLGSVVGGWLRVSERERRILLVAGTAAGMAAVFRTPLGAALLAVEVLHRDDFESDALVPSVLASVVAYSIFISFFGESTLFAHAPHYPFVPAHLPLYGLMAVLVSGAATLFLACMDQVRHVSAKLRAPAWSKPAVGALVLGLSATLVIMVLGPYVGHPGRGFGILGGGYGAAQIAITGSDWFPGGWRGVTVLLVMAAVKIVATSLTVGSGGSAGDFGPSLVIGALFGGAFGRAAQLLLGDPRIDPGAFALVGMGTFYGGLAHVPIGSLVMVCELAGSYDLLVPLMLAEGIAFVVLRKRALYHAQVRTRRDSPAHRDELVSDALQGICVADVMKEQPYVAFEERTSARDVVTKVAESTAQDIFPVLAPGGQVTGVISAEVLRTMAQAPELGRLAIAHDLMQSPVLVRAADDLRTAIAALMEGDVRELVVVDDELRVIGLLDEAEITRAYHEATAILPKPSDSFPDLSAAR